LLFVPAWLAPKLRTGAYVQDVTATSAVVALIEAEPRALEVVLTADGEPQRRLGASARRRHALRVEGLAPAESYRYEILDSAQRRVDAGGLRTYPAEPNAAISFCVVGDSGALPPWVWMQEAPAVQALDALGLLPGSSENSRIGAAMAALHPDLWLHVGDMIYPHGEERHAREAFFRPFAELLKHSPCYAVLGNHDLGGSEEERYQDQGRPLLRHLVLPRGKTTGDSRCYSFACGPVRFIALDLNFVITQDHPSLVHLERELAAAKEPWRIAFSHYPLWSGSRQRDRADLLKSVRPLLEKSKVAVVFAGHDHVYQRFVSPSGMVQVTSGGGGKSLYSLEPHALCKAEASSFHFCHVTVAGDKLTLRALTASGQVLDEFTLNKP